MKGRIIFKALLTLVVVVWAALNIVPWTDTPFESYVAQEARAEADTFLRLLDRAKTEAVAMDGQTTYLRLRAIARAEKLDLAAHFPQIKLADVRNLDKRNDILLRELLRRSQGKIKLGLDLKGGVSFTFAVNEENLSGNELERTEQLSQALEIIRSRVDSLGVAEPQVRLIGGNRIEVQLPGASTRDNPEIAQTVGKPAILEFSTVHRTAMPGRDPAPIGFTEMVESREDSRTGEIQEVRWYVKTIPDMDGAAVARSYASMNPSGGFEVLLNFTSEGSDQFAALTRRIAEENQRTGSIGQLAIILDGQLYSAPTVREAIIGGRASISGNFSQREAGDLANVLNNPLAVGLKIEETFEIGPSLAASARSTSLLAAAVGGGLVIVFMVLYYGVAGIVSVTSVFVNLLIVLGALTSFGATMSLPGVAALVLTIGMGVDGNILIFERMREELAAGKNLRHALQSGYEKAFSTILDSNLTTLLTAGILIWLGTGPIKGFGVILAIGIVATLFCSLIVSRFLLEALVYGDVVKKLFGFTFLKNANFKFLEYARPAFAASWLLVLIGVIAIGVKRDDILGIDFVGGEEVTLTFATEIETDRIEEIAASAGVEEMVASYRTAVGGGGEMLKIQTPNDQSAILVAALQAAEPAAGLSIVGTNEIGAAIGAEVQRSAFMSLGLALVGILLYVAIRFQFGYGIGAVVATVHDVLMTIGIFVLLPTGQFTAPMVASILMVVGYSLNDTIIVFDRIREELDLHPEKNLKDIVTLSINRTLARTFLTSGSTAAATLALYIFSTGVVQDFALVFLIGIITGTFSSIYIASPVFYWFHKGDRKKVEATHVLPTYEWETGAKPAAPEKA